MINKFFLALCLISLPLAASADPPSLSLKKGEHLVLIGNTSAERMQYFGYFETLLNLHYADANPVIRNMGWSGDEVVLHTLQVLKGGGYITQKTDEPVALQPRPFQFGSVEDHLTKQKADVVMLFFGFNEAFKGKAGLAKFAADYQTFIERLQAGKFNGKSAPRLVLISPFAVEKLDAPFPDPAERNANLKLYTAKIAEIAASNKLGFVDLFSPTIETMSKGSEDALTVNGVHLKDKGQRMVAEILATGLGITEPWTEKADAIRKLIVDKNKQFFFRWRPINGEYVYGRRNDPFGIVSYPPEMVQLDKMIADLEQKIWAESGKLKSSSK